MQDAPLQLLKFKTVFALDFLFSNFYHLFEVRLDNFYVLPLLIYDALCPPFARPESIFQGVHSIFQLFFVDDELLHLARQFLIHLTDKCTHFLNDLWTLVLGVMELAACLKEFLSKAADSTRYFVLNSANDHLSSFFVVL